MENRATGMRKITMMTQKIYEKISNGSRWKRLHSRIAAFVLIGVMGLNGFQTVSASAISDAQNKKNSAQSSLNSAKNNIGDIQNKKDDLQSEINSLDSDLVHIIADMGILKDELSNKQTQLNQANADLEKAKADEKKQYDNMKKRIRYMYENGETSYVDILLGASNFGDFLNRIEYTKQVYEYDRNLLTTFQKTQQQVADLKTQLEGDKAELEEMQASYQDQEKQYESMIASKKSTMTNFDAKLADAKNLAAQYQSVIEKQNAVIQEQQKQQAVAAKAAADAAKKAADSGKPSTNTNTNAGGSGANPAHTTNVSGSSVVGYATKFVGNPYVSGGTSLTNGCDCSGFVMSVFANFGVNLPHSSYALQTCGSEVSYDNAQPGDLICYAGHVGIYIGGGQIVNASSSAPYPIGGIKTNTATYRQILTVRRVI
jgi:cell wall-associated NlpC family hydrolase